MNNAQYIFTYSLLVCRKKFFADDPRCPYFKCKAVLSDSFTAKGRVSANYLVLLEFEELSLNSNSNEYSKKGKNKTKIIKKIKLYEYNKKE